MVCSAVCVMSSCEVNSHLDRVRTRRILSAVQVVHLARISQEMQARTRCVLSVVLLLYHVVSDEMKQAAKEKVCPESQERT